MAAYPSNAHIKSDFGKDFPSSDSCARLRAEVSVFQTWHSLGKNSTRVASGRCKTSIHANKGFAEAPVGDYLQHRTSRMADQSTAQVHHALHDRAQATACCFFQADDPGIEQGLAHHPKHVGNQGAEPKVQFVDGEFSRGQTLQVEFAFDFREILLTGSSIPVEAQDIGVGDFHKIRPAAEDLVLRQQKCLPLFARAFRDLIDQADRTDSLALPDRTPDIHGLARPGRVRLPLLSGQGDQDLGGLLAQVVAGDEGVLGFLPGRHERHVVHPQQASVFDQLAQPQADSLMVGQCPVMQGMMVSGAELGAHDQSAVQKGADGSVTRRHTFLFCVAVVENGGVGVDPRTDESRYVDDSRLEVQFAQHPEGASRQSVMNATVKTHAFEPLAQSGLRGHAPQAQGRSKKGVVFKLANMVEPHLADGNKATQATQDVLLGDLMVSRFPFDAGGIDVAYTHEFAHRRKSGIANDRFTGQFKGPFVHSLHLVGEKSLRQVNEVNMPAYLTFFTTSYCVTAVMIGTLYGFRTITEFIQETFKMLLLNTIVRAEYKSLRIRYEDVHLFKGIAP